MIEQLRIKRIAKKIRLACVTFAHSEEAANYDFFVFSDGCYDDGLGGMCAIASFALRDELKAAGYSAKVMHGLFDDDIMDGTHCWVVVNDAWIVDVTATQFGDRNPNVLMTTINDPRYKHAQEMKHMGRFKEWPDSQKPEPNVVTTLIELVHGKREVTPAEQSLFDSEQVDFLYKPTYGCSFITP